MPQETWTAVDAYFNELLVEEDAALRAAVADADAARLPAIQVAPTRASCCICSPG